MFFTHNTQYSLLLLIHVHVQCDLVITRFICVNVCSLICLDLFLKYKIGQTCLVCVCVLGFMCLIIFLLRDVFERSKCCLDPWLSCMVDCIHICIFLFLKNCFLSNLYSSLTAFDTQLIYRALQFLFIAISTPLDSQVDRSRSFLSPRQILDNYLNLSSFFCLGQLLNSYFYRTLLSSTDPRHFSICRELLRCYIRGTHDLSLILLDISLSFQPFHLPKPLSFTLNLFLKDSLTLIKFSSLGKCLNPSYFAFHDF